MSFYDENTIQTVKDAADILEIVGESVSLKKTGVNYKGLCPFHSEKTPSFTVNPARQYFHCFGCSEGGNVLHFVMKSQNMGFIEAVKYLAGRYNIVLPEKTLSPRERENSQKKEVIYQINRQAAAAYHEYLLHTPKAARARQYLKERGIPAAIIEEFELGCAPPGWDFVKRALADFNEQDIMDAGLVVQGQRGTYDRFRDRMLSPIFTHNGKHIGFSGRILGDGQPKYLNTPDSLVFNKGNILLGLFQNKAAIRAAGKCLLVEGNFDLLALAAQGIRNVAAPMGTAMTAQHVRSLKGYINEAILLFDGDQAGVKAAMRAVPLFLNARLDAKVVVLPPKHDPDTFVREYGSDGLAKKVAEAESLPDFIFEHLTRKHGLSLEGKGRIIEDLKPVIGAIADDSLQRTLFVSHFSRKLGLLPEQLLGQFTSGAQSRQGEKSWGKEVGVVEEENTTAGRKFSLSKIEAQLLGFLIIYPEYINRLVEASLDEEVTSTSGQLILQQLQKLAQGNQGGPERLMDMVQGPERTFVSEQLISLPPASDGEVEEEVLEKVRWLERNRVHRQMKKLTAQINEAQSQGDDKSLQTLLAAKDEMRKKMQEK
ncbi:MAG: DNA primase [Deltaproteobacteria bacterium]|nr:DNA primase [Deltaproteobacteria bacterium]